ncbi:MAG: hypothetical protein K6A96_02060, partial [Prevotella sp.]|nr:hypothetical protein [Prevotella sp.]
IFEFSSYLAVEHLGTAARLEMIVYLGRQRRRLLRLALLLSHAMLLLVYGVTASALQLHSLVEGMKSSC